MPYGSSDSWSFTRHDSSLPRARRLLSEKCERALEDLVPARADPLHGGLDPDVGDEADALEPATVGVPHLVAREHDVDPARKDELRGAAVGSGGVGADEPGAVGGLEKEPGFLLLWHELHTEDPREKRELMMSTAVFARTDENASPFKFSHLREQTCPEEMHVGQLQC